MKKMASMKIISSPSPSSGFSSSESPGSPTSPFAKSYSYITLENKYVMSPTTNKTVNRINVADALSNKEYYTITIITYSLIVTGGILIKDISYVYGLIGSISCVLLAYILPAAFFLK